MDVEKLENLAKHVKYDMDRSTWDFGQISVRGCGCAIKEFPVLWADSFGDMQSVLFHFKDGARFFGIPEDCFEHLFQPSEKDKIFPPEQNTKKYGGKILYRDATPDDIHDQIMALIEKTKGNIYYNEEQVKQQRGTGPNTDDSLQLSDGAS